ncbi:uncharacterized protein [Antedon mediterranea]|uniref:uncharacterized protein n=1 Tax=Antedon mediterranea TaxID=105859 RepID=UPI003AF942EC
MDTKYTILGLITVLLTFPSVNSTTRPISTQPRNAKVCEASVCVCKPGYFGPQCENRCEPIPSNIKPDNAKNCSDSKRCLCEPGWYGCLCESRCPVPFYGPRCRDVHECNQDNIESYDKINGACSCSAGWMGKHCDSRCADWTFGTKCEHNCTCNHNRTEFCKWTTGECVCRDNWSGATCDDCDDCDCTDECSSKSAVYHSLWFQLGIAILSTIVFILLLVIVYRAATKKRRNKKFTPPIPASSIGDTTSIYDEGDQEQYINMNQMGRSVDCIFDSTSWYHSSIQEEE